MPHENTPLLALKQLSKTFYYGKKPLMALQDVELCILKGETLGLAGESGCGKSTLGKIVLGLDKPTSGQVFYQGNDINQLSKTARQHLRCKLQMVFQDPYASLDPRMTIEDIIGEGLDIHQLAKGSDRRDRINQLLIHVGLPPLALHSYPHEFSGGQRQRIGIARALAVKPDFLVCDEPLSALDACTQKQVMQLLLNLKKNENLTYLFISHDMHAMRIIADRIAVMYLGKIVELAETALIFKAPAHPYTEALLSAIPIPDPFLEKKRERIVLKGELPSPLAPPNGCPFHPRCPKAKDICQSVSPKLLSIGQSHHVACHFPNV